MPRSTTRPPRTESRCLTSTGVARLAARYNQQAERLGADAPVRLYKPSTAAEPKRALICLASTSGISAGNHRERACLTGWCFIVENNPRRPPNTVAAVCETRAEALQLAITLDYTELA